jgi:hypothetical protein
MICSTYLNFYQSSLFVAHNNIASVQYSKEQFSTFHTINSTIELFEKIQLVQYICYKEHMNFIDCKEGHHLSKLKKMFTTTSIWSKNHMS